MRRPTVVLAMVAIVTVILAAGLPRLTTRLDLLALYASAGGGAPVAPAVLLALPDGVSGDEVAAARRDAKAVAGVSEIQTLVVPDDVPAVVANQIATAMWGRGEARPAVLKITLDDASAEVLATLEEVSRDHGGALLGLPVLDEAHRRLVTRAIAQLLAIVAVVFFAILTALWRRPAAALVPIGAVAIGVVWFLGLVGWFRVPLGGPMLALVPLVAVLGLTDAIHVAWRLSLLPDDEPGTAATALLQVGRACLWTSLTTGAGLLALLVTDSTILHRFGVWGAVGMALVFVTGVGLPAALLLRFPGLAPAPRTIVVFGLDRVRPSRGVAFALTLVILAGLGAAATSVRVDLIPGNDLPRHHPTFQRHVAHDAALGGLHPVRVRVIPRAPDGTSDPDAFVTLVALQRAAVNHPAVGSVVSFADAMLIVGRAGRRTIEQIVGRPGDRRSARIRRYVRARESALEAAGRFTALPLDDGGAWTMHLRLHHVGASQWAALFRELRQIAGERAWIELDGYPAQVVRTRARLVRDAWAVFGIAGGVALVCLALLTRRPVALVAVPLVAATGLAVLAGLALTGVPLSHANLFALSVAIGVAIDPWIHLVVARGDAHSGPPVVVGQGLVVVGLLLLATSEVTTLAQTGPVLAGAVVLNGVVTGLLWLSGRSRAAAR